MKTAVLVSTEEARKGFYPTPPQLAAKLLSDIKWDMIQDVLDPSAGKGDLVKAVLEKFIEKETGSGDERKINIDCVEIDPYLRSILQYEFCGAHQNEIFSQLRVLREKGELTLEEKAQKQVLIREFHRLKRLSLHIVHDDFRTFKTRKHYDLIVMNPPFADGALHLLKALELQRDGGIIRCILNAETIRNPYTNVRKLLVSKLDQLNAEIEFVDNAFVDSERQTDVSVALIKVSIPTEARKSTIFERLQKAAELSDPIPPDVTDLTVTDFIQQIVTRFDIEVDAGIELIREYDAMKPYIMDSFEEKPSLPHPTLTLCVGTPDRFSYGETPSINKYVKLVRKKYWEALFSNKAFVGKLTSNLRKKYINMVESMEDLDFTLFNIQQIAEQMNSEMIQGIQDTIIELFDRLTAKHAWFPECEKNRHYFNGWKTNKVHKIGNKVILPVNGMFSSYSLSETFDVGHAESTISDIEKVFDYLDGNATASVDLHGVLTRACESGQTKNIRCKYFDVTLYKKGTMHIKFRNQDLVDRFNIYCCRQKNWLPPNYGKTSYADMSREERAVIDGFHGDGCEGAGEKSYRLVMSQPAYYLAEPTREMPTLMASARK